VYCLDADPSDGRDEGQDDEYDYNYDRLWNYLADNSFVSSPAIAEEKLVIGCLNGFVYCFAGTNAPPAFLKIQSPKMVVLILCEIQCYNGIRVTDSDDTDSVTYDVWLGSHGQLQKVVDNQTEVVFDTGCLEPETLYDWQIIAWDNHGAFTYGPVWSFYHTTKHSAQYTREPNPC